MIMYKGQIKGFPIEVVEKMLERQVEQGNKRDVTVFEGNKCAGFDEGGFDWHKTDKTIESFTFWTRVTQGSFDLFFERYPKSETLQQEESKQDLKVGDNTNFGVITDIKDNSICFGKNKVGVDIWYKKSFVKLEPKQQTIEEAAENNWDKINSQYKNGLNPYAHKIGFIDGVKSEAAKQYWFEQFNKLK